MGLYVTRCRLIELTSALTLHHKPLMLSLSCLKFDYNDLLFRGLKSAKENHVNDSYVYTDRSPSDIPDASCNLPVKISLHGGIV